MMLYKKNIKIFILFFIVVSFLCACADNVNKEQLQQEDNYCYGLFPNNGTIDVRFEKDIEKHLLIILNQAIEDKKTSCVIVKNASKNICSILKNKALYSNIASIIKQYASLDNIEYASAQLNVRGLYFWLNGNYSVISDVDKNTFYDISKYIHDNIKEK